MHTREIPSGPSPDTIHRLILLALEPYPFILSIVLRHEAIPNRIILRDNHIHVVVSVQNWDQFQSLGDEIRDKMGRFELISVNQIDQPGEPLGTGQISEILTTKLTDNQIEAIETAYSMGYFEVPRKVTAHTVSERLAIAQSTFSERLRKAQNNLFELIFGSK
jgi:predicted DNA binding protein